ncbi:hypothetical protein [Rhodobacter capsulatus]|uniref:hypothetical protein n=1 Tax=Rhodobacter capsulatus TaxID=1061 RepID=UPI00402590EF
MSDKKKTCGIVMPISECDGRPAAHWQDVLNIITAAATESGFHARLVSDTFETNLIHKEILRNIYNDDIVICDVSGRNPNVFFELGIRMATQKPTIIIKDNVTIYPFDTSVNRYVEYPRDLRYPLMEKFKIEIKSMLEKVSKQAPDQSFIGQLGPFQIPKVESSEISAADAILERLTAIERRVSGARFIAPNASSLRRRGNFKFHPNGRYQFRARGDNAATVCIKGIPENIIEEAIKEMQKHSHWKASYNLEKLEDDHFHLNVDGLEVGSQAFDAELFDALDEAVPF